MGDLRALAYRFILKALLVGLCGACGGDKFTTADRPAGGDSERGGSGGSATGGDGTGASSEVGGSTGSGHKRTSVLMETSSTTGTTRTRTTCRSGRWRTSSVKEKASQGCSNHRYTISQLVPLYDFSQAA